MDGVSYSLTDSVLGIWLICVPTQARYLVGAVRKSLVCRCGCRGWCSYWSILNWMKWSIEALARGSYPTSRHDGEPWLVTDNYRRELAGQPLTMKSAIIRLKGDWAEFCERFGFPTWQSSLRPCFLCASSGDDLYNLGGGASGNLRWHINTDAEVDRACARCELHVRVVDRAQQARLALLLAYERDR